ncbi:DUF4873 domain-containing protein [Amycolatopsis cynarae]|uniref:DUF4873 domain-containing protein n=1 Tax=Amycolatopsis cynarae TaxID=2995223 RepID=A0ABY7B1Q4_9PSEU|nr:DUF4873 domain-containing protein [Amycolatopsis sp. HUAS 11-8]WAL64846.1 DUF4873 domain-containing protein [Amycolatopsis sp. HUAS 11-8]
MPVDGEDGYRGPATLVVDGTELTVEVELRGHFQPIDGYYRWYGRITRDERLHTLLGGRKKPGELRTPEGEARCEVSDPDPWGRYRLLGTSTPPFTVPKTLAGLAAE